MSLKRPRVSESNHEISKSIYESVKGSHEYDIKGYSLTRGTGVGKSITSGRFTVAGYGWKILFYPDGANLSVSIKLKSPGEVRAWLELKLLDQTGNGQYDRPTTLYKLKRGGSMGYKRSALEASSFLKDDCLKFHCTIGVVRTRVGNGKRYVIPVPPPDMIQNLKVLLESKIGSDITFEVGNEFFRAHKVILAARSPVFRAQFFGLVGNPDMEIVVIKEVDPFAFKAMLLFLYSDELPETHELSDSDPLCTPTTIVQHLLAVADRFGLARLKLMCEEKLYEDLTADTVENTLAIADV